MTRPSERTRALRWGGEFLNELLAADNIGSDLKVEVASILMHYPSEGQIRDWAASWPEHPFGPWLAPEEVTIKDKADPMNPAVDQASNSLKAFPATPSDRARALRLAGELFTRIRSGPSLNVEQKRSVLYVLRHYPGASDIEFYALI